MTIQCLLAHKELVSLVASFSTLIIAFVALVFAFLQWRTNKNRLQHELFDRRYTQFEVVKDFLGGLGSAGRMTPEAERKLLVGTRGIRFLYSKEIEEYIDECVLGLAMDLNLYNDEANDPEKIKEGIARKRGDHMKKILIEIRSVENKFAPYLQLKS